MQTVEKLKTNASLVPCACASITVEKLSWACTTGYVQVWTVVYHWVRTLYCTYSMSLNHLCSSRCSKSILVQYSKIVWSTEIDKFMIPVKNRGDSLRPWWLTKIYEYTFHDDIIRFSPKRTHIQILYENLHPLIYISCQLVTYIGCLLSVENRHSLFFVAMPFSEMFLLTSANAYYNIYIDINILYICQNRAPFCGFSFYRCCDAKN